MPNVQKKEENNELESHSVSEKRAYVSQSDVPSCGIDEALRVGRTIVDNYAGKPATPLHVAQALGQQPTSGCFRQLCGASIAYNLTEGGYNAQHISLTPLGKRIISPLSEGEDVVALREAFLKPRVVGEFLRKYDGSPLPKKQIALNVLQDMGVPAKRSEKVLLLILEGAEQLGLLRDIKTKRYVDLSSPDACADLEEGPVPATVDNLDDRNEFPSDNAVKSSKLKVVREESNAETGLEVSRRVYITHGKNKTFIEPIKQLLGFGELIPVISVEKPSVSKPVPEKVLSDMRGCGAAIIHVETEKVFSDDNGETQPIVNSNVLIEIGAAMALYGNRFILLVAHDVKLPSNLQGLFEVRYEGEKLDGSATIRLLEAINDMKKHKVPDRR